MLFAPRTRTGGGSQLVLVCCRVLHCDEAILRYKEEAQSEIVCKLPHNKEVELSGRGPTQIDKFFSGHNGIRPFSSLKTLNMQIEAELVWKHRGQRHAYGDSHYECEIHTKQELSDNDILQLTKETGRLPYEEWKKRTGNISDYFKGYYTITKTDYGYYYHGVYPYDD